MKQKNLWIQAHLRGTLLLLVIASLLGTGAIQTRLVHAAGTAGKCPAGQYCSFLPVVTGPRPSGDLVLSGIEVTQSVQNSQENVPLVAGRNTMLRVYAHANQFSQAVPNVKIALQGTTSANTSLSSSPQSITATVPLSNSQANYASTINIPLPLSWTSGTIDVAVKLDSNNAVMEQNEDNNTLSLHLVFNPVPPLQVKIVPILYHNSKNGHTYPAPSTDDVSDWIMRTYPISKIQLTWHAPYAFTGDLSGQADFGKLLNEISSLKSTEGSPSAQSYYGLIPTSDGGSTWFYGGIAGLGWVGWNAANPQNNGPRAAIGLDLDGQTSQIAAHEIGHNLGMSHTPCGGAAGPDPNYPYSDGSIGQYGLDVASGVVYPPSTSDMMSYCNPKWISDYTYKELFSNQMHIGTSTASSLVVSELVTGRPQRGLLVRADITPQGVSLLPAYVLPGQVTQAPPQAGDYQVQVLGENGQTLVQAPVQASAIGDDAEIQMSGIHTMIALPDQPAAMLRLLKDGKVLAEQPLQAGVTAQPAGVTVDRSEKDVRLRWDSSSSAGQKPALVRYSTDGGQTWTTLRVDATGGELSVPSDLLPAGNVNFEVIPAGAWK